MKKVFVIMALAALASCGGSDSAATTDTAAAAVDTTATVDTAAAAADTTASADTTAPAAAPAK